MTAIDDFYQECECRIDALYKELEIPIPGTDKDPRPETQRRDHSTLADKVSILLLILEGANVPDGIPPFKRWENQSLHKYIGQMEHYLNELADKAKTFELEVVDCLHAEGQDDVIAEHYPGFTSTKH